jgi:hypothetical protein
VVLVVLQKGCTPIGAISHCQRYNVNYSVGQRETQLNTSPQTYQISTRSFIVINIIYFPSRWYLTLIAASATTPESLTSSNAAFEPLFNKHSVDPPYTEASYHEKPTQTPGPPLLSSLGGAPLFSEQYAAQSSAIARSVNVA